MDTTQTVFRSAKLTFLGSLLSRFSGVAREMTMAFCFGASPEVAAFLIAYRLSNLCRRLIGEGNLQAGFVPQYETLRVEDPNQAFSFYRDMSYSLGAIAFVVIFILEIALWGFSAASTPSWRQVAEQSMSMAPGLFFITLSGLNQAFLQTEKKYFGPAASPVAFNFVWIAAALATRSLSALSLGVTIAYAGQWLFTSYLSARINRFATPHKPLHFFSPPVKKVLGSMGLGILGVGAAQLNSALDPIFSRFSDLSGPAHLWYAIKVAQLPLALFGLALAGALLPPLSRAVQEQNLERYRTLLWDALRRTAAWMIPCTFGLIVLGRAGLNLLFGRGDFSSADVEKTAACLTGYALGLFPSILVTLLAQSFYARKSYWLPARASLLSVGTNMALNALFVFVFGWGAPSIAWGTSLSAIVNCWVLWRSHSLAALDRRFAFFCLKLTAASLIPALLTILSQRWIWEVLPRTFSAQAACFVTLAGLYFGGFFGVLKIAKLEEAIFQKNIGN